MYLYFTIFIASKSTHPEVLIAYRSSHDTKYTNISKPLGWIMKDEEEQRQEIYCK